MFDLEADLIFQIFGVGEGGVVEDEKVGKGREDEVYDEAEEPGETMSVFFDGCAKQGASLLTRL